MEIDGDEDEDPENMEQYVFMEIKSTVSFKEIDIDEMLKHATLEDLMKGMYMNKKVEKRRVGPSEDEQILEFYQTGKAMNFNSGDSEDFTKKIEQGGWDFQGTG